MPREAREIVHPGAEVTGSCKKPDDVESVNST